MFQLAIANIHVGPQTVREANVLGRYDKGRWELDLLEARLGNGWIFGQGSLSAGGEVSGTLYSTGLSASSFDALAGRRDLDFRIDLHLQARGKLQAPEITGWVKIYDTVFNGRPLGDTVLKAAATTDVVDVSGKLLGGVADLKAHVFTEPGLPYLALLSFDVPTVGRFLPRERTGMALSGRVAGGLKAAGRVANLLDSKALVTLRQFDVTAAGLRVINRSNWQIALSERRVALSDVSLAGKQVSLSAEGVVDLSTKPFRLDVRGQGWIDADPFRRWVSWIEHASGRLAFDLHAFGRIQRPSFTGRAYLQARALKFGPWPQQLDEVSARVRFDERMLDVVKLDARVGGGTVTGLGRINWRRYVPERISISFDLDHVYSRVTSKIDATVSGGMGLTLRHGKLLTLDGRLTAHRARYREKTSLSRLSQGLFRKRLLPHQAYDASGEVLGLDIAVSFPDTLEVDYDLGLIRFITNMGGRLRVTGSNERLGLLGELESNSGSVEYLTRRFTMRRAIVGFTDRYSIVPRIKVQADLVETVDRGELEGGESEYRIFLDVEAEGDRQPLIRLTSEPPLEERDIVTLLNFGVTGQDVETFRSEDLLGLGSEILARSLDIDRRLQALLPVPTQVVQPRYVRIRSRYSGSSKAQRAGAISPRLEVGASLNFISPNLMIEYGRSLYNEFDQNLDLSYRFSARTTAKLRWENTEQETTLVNIGDIGLDLKFQWEW